MNVDPFSPNGIQDNSNGSTDSPSEMDPTAHTPGPQSEKSMPEKSEITKISSSPAFIPAGGSLSRITKEISEVVTNGLPQATKDATLGFIQRNANGFVGGLAMRCKGEHGCPIADSCPLLMTNQPVPEGSQCPFEMSLIQTWVNKHLLALGIDDYASPENSFDMDLLYELAAHELIKWKAAQHISQKGSLIDDRQVAASVQGDAIFAEVISPALEIIDTNNKITMKIKDVLLATRKAQIQAGKDMADPSKRTAALADKAREKIKERLQSVENIKDAEFKEKG